MTTEQPRAFYLLTSDVINPDKGNAWTDLTESEPRRRARLKEHITRPASLVVLADGSLKYDKDLIEVSSHEEDQDRKKRSDGEKGSHVRAGRE